MESKKKAVVNVGCAEVAVHVMWIRITGLYNAEVAVHVIVGIVVGTILYILLLLIDFTCYAIDMLC